MIKLESAINGTSSAPSPSYVMRQLNGTSVALGWMSICISSHIDKARPMTSKPGPMFADEQGTSGIECGVSLDPIKVSSG